MFTFIGEFYKTVHSPLGLRPTLLVPEYQIYPLVKVGGGHSPIPETGIGNYMYVHCCKVWWFLGLTNASLCFCMKSSGLEAQFGSSISLMRVPV